MVFFLRNLSYFLFHFFFFFFFSFRSFHWFCIFAALAPSNPSATATDDQASRPRSEGNICRTSIPPIIVACRLIFGGSSHRYRRQCTFPCNTNLGFLDTTRYTIGTQGSSLRSSCSVLRTRCWCPWNRDLQGSMDPHGEIGSDQRSRWFYFLQ